MKYKLCDEVYLIDEWKITLEKHKIHSIHIERGARVDGRDQTIKYGINKGHTMVEEESIYTKEEAANELLKRVQARHAGDLAQVKRVTEAV
jgi:hypothetical protein